MLDLFLVEFLNDFGFLSEVKEDPGTGSRAGVLAGHEKGNHDVSDFVVLEGLAVTVLLVEKGSDHVVFIGLPVMEKSDSIRTPGEKERDRNTHVAAFFSALADNVDVEVAHLLLGLVTLAVTWEREVGEEPVKRGESTIEIGESLSVVLGDGLTNFPSLKSTRSSQDSNFRDGVEDVKAAPFVDVVHLENTERRILVHKVDSLFLNHAHVGTEVLETETKFDEFLLFHKHFVRAVVNHIFAEDGGR